MEPPILENLSVNFQNNVPNLVMSKVDFCLQSWIWLTWTKNTRLSEYFSLSGDESAINNIGTFLFLHDAWQLVSGARS